MKRDLNLLVAAAIALLMALPVLSIPLVRREAAVPAWNEQGPSGAESLSGVSEFIFGNYVFPFEVLSILLLVALVGAIFLAQKEPEGEP